MRAIRMLSHTRLIPPSPFSLSSAIFPGSSGGSTSVVLDPSSPPSWCAPSVLYFLVPQVLLISCFKRLKLGKLGKCCLSLEEVPVEVGRIRLVHAFRRSLGSGNSCLLWTGPQRWLHIRLRATPKTHNRPQSMRDSNNSCPASPLFPRGQAKKAIKLMQSGVTRL